MKVDGNDVVRYRTINECLAAYFEVPVNEIDNMQGRWSWQDADGTEYEEDCKDGLKLIRKRACWGWVEDKKTIHVFIRKRATMRQIIKLFAHEIGHMQHPFHRSNKEEQKANIYAKVACGAYDLAKEIKESS